MARAEEGEQRAKKNTSLLDGIVSAMMIKWHLQNIMNIIINQVRREEYIYLVSDRRCRRRSRLVSYC